MPTEKIESFSLRLYSKNFNVTDFKNTIAVENIEVYFCYDKEDFVSKPKQLSIYTIDENTKLEYKDNEKIQLGVKLYNNKKIEPIGNESAGKITWFVYQLGYNPLAGLTGAQLEERLEITNLEQMAGTNWKYIGEGYEQEIVTNKLFSQTNIRACLVGTDDEIGLPTVEMEDFIVFNNTEKVVDISGAEAAAAGDARTKLRINDDNIANFFIYGHDGRAVRSQDITIVPYFIDGNVPTTGTISYFFPKTGSQIIAPECDVDEDGNNLPSHTKGEVVWDYSETDTEIKITKSYENDFPEYQVSFYDINYYRSNNTIRCEITQDGDRFFCARALTFGDASTSGTGYRLNLICLDDSWAFAPWSNMEGQTRRFKISLEDKSGNDLSSVLRDNLEKIKIEILNCPERMACYVDNSDLIFEVRLTASGLLAEDGMPNNFMILKASVSDVAVINNDKAVTLTCKYPVSLRWGDVTTGLGWGYDHIQKMVGATKVVYDNSGNYPTYDDAQYQLFSNNTFVEDIKWRLNVSEPNCLSLVNNSLEPSYTLRTSKEIKANIYATAYRNGYNWPVWSQTIIVDTISYLSDLVNSWDNASVEIDSENGTILSQFVGAGTKNSDNEFSGVFMGVVRKGDTTKENLTGLFGYQDGQLRFKFDENGNAYIGNGNDQYIKFDNGGLDIKSNSFDLVSNNLIITSHPSLDTSNSVFIYRKNKDDDPFFALNPIGWSNIGNWNISDTSIFKLSDSPADGEETGVGMSGDNSQILPAIWAGYGNTIGPPNQLNWETTEKPKFYVTNQGFLAAESAKIAKWNISSESLNNTNDTRIDFHLKSPNVSFTMDGGESVFMCGNIGQGIEITKTDIAYYMGNVPIVTLGCAPMQTDSYSYGLSLRNLVIFGDQFTDGKLEIDNKADILIWNNTSGKYESLKELLNIT